MITAQNISLRFGSRTLFEKVNLKFTSGNCYGIIGANGCGKSTFLKIISGDIEQSAGELQIDKKARISFLKQDHYEFDKYTVLETVIMGHKELYDLMSEKDAIYLKPDFSDADGIKAAELECEFAELNGWEADSQAAQLLKGVGIKKELLENKMESLEGSDKVRVLLAQALFGNPDILIMDEPTNHLDVHTIMWLEDFLFRFDNTVIVVSHDRQFLNKVCTHTVDIDYNTMKTYPGNYAFWRQASDLVQKQKQDQNKKTEDKMEELKDFIRRFSANASKSKQATSRKNTLSKLSLDDIKPTSRKSPFIHFKPFRESGSNILEINKIHKSIDGEQLIKNFNLEVYKGEKVAFVSRDTNIVTALFNILAGDLEADSGEYKWGITTTQAYLPRDNGKFFETDLNLINWLRQYTNEQDITFIRGFLGKMLFSGDETLKCANVLSGGEKVRCMLSKMMASEANVLMFDDPTNHLDLESITALNNSLIDFPETILFTSHDHQFIQSVANRIIEIAPNGFINKQMSYEDYLEDADVKKRQAKLYGDDLAKSK